MKMYQDFRIIFFYNKKTETEKQNFMKEFTKMDYFDE